LKIDLAKLEFWDCHELMVSAVLPRPIAFISTIGPDGVYNLAPFSYAIPVAVKPALIGVSISRKRDGQKKDTVVNIEYAKDYVINVVTEELAKPMNQSAKEYPSHIDEFKEVGLTPIPGDLVKSPRVAESPVNMECRLVQILEFGEMPRLTSFIIGEVVRVHVRDEMWEKDAVIPQKLRAIGRMGKDYYCRTLDIFEMKRP
jgi:flavin reductase (DIM6/NTAB) family NADH-FMN oxidoreductase RutF